LLFGTGVVPAHYLSLPIGGLLAAAVALLLAALAVGRWPGLRLVVIAALLPVLGALRHETATEVLPPDHVARLGLLGRDGVFVGIVQGEPEQDADRVRLILALTEAQIDSLAAPVSGRMLVTARGVALTADAGDRVTVRGRLRQPPTARNPGAFDYRAYLAVQGIHGTLSVRRPEQLLAVEPRPGPWLHEHAVMPVRRAVRQAILANLSGAPAGLLLGMLLGEKQGIPEEVMEGFRVTGLAHALVVSGMNVELLATFLLTGFSLCRLPARVAGGIMIPVVALYALVTQLQAPVVRAALMSGAMLSGRLLDRSGEVYNSLGVAALGILAFWPASLMGLSFQLSFAATLGIVALYRPLIGLFPEVWRSPDGWRGQWLVGPLAVTVAALAGTGPLMAWQFRQFSPVGLIANVAAVPLLGASLCLGTLAALVGWCVPLVAAVFNACNWVVLTALVWLVDRFAGLPFASITTPPVGLGFLIWCALLAVLAAWMPTSHRARKAALLVLLLGLNAAVWGHLFRDRALVVVGLDVGQGDAVVLRFPDGKTALVDGGDRTAEFDYGARVILPYLRHEGIERLDLVVGTHAHGDHLGGLVSVLEGIEVAHYLDGGQQADGWIPRRIQEVVAERRIGYIRLTAGDSLAGLGGTGVLVLHPTPEFVTADGASPHGLNNGSVVLRLTYGAISLLLTGDVEAETDQALGRWSERLRARVLKVAHHGSPTSSSPAFLAAVQPGLALVSVGEGNRFGHPSAAVLGRYLDRGTEVLRTDQRGAVEIRVDQEEIQVRAMIDD
jgi:competence protein ComEC